MCGCNRPDCADRLCRKRWLTGSTTADDYRPAPIAALLLDILETWSPSWFTLDNLRDHAERIRPGINLDSVRVNANLLQTAGRGRVCDEDGPMWITVEARPDPQKSDSTDYGWLLRVPRRACWPR